MVNGRVKCSIVEEVLVCTRELKNENRTTKNIKMRFVFYEIFKYLIHLLVALLNKTKEYSTNLSV